MKNVIHIKNTFRSSSDDAMKTAVTEKIRRLINIQLKKQHTID